MNTQISFTCKECNILILSNVDEIEICSDENIILENKKIEECNIKIEEMYKSRYDISESGMLKLKREDGSVIKAIKFDVYKQPLKEYRYVLCPLCKGKNFLPLINSILK